MRSRNKPYLFLFLSLTDKIILNRTYLRPTIKAVKTQLIFYTGKKHTLSRVRPAFRIFKIKSFIANRKRGSHIRTFFKAKPKAKSKVKKK